MQIILYTANGTIQFEVSTSEKAEDIIKALAEESCMFETIEGTWITIDASQAIATEVRDLSKIILTEDNNDTPPVS